MEHQYLKVEMHAHSNEDPEDYKLPYSAKSLIDEAKKKGYDVLGLTLHNKVLEGKELASLKRYAASKGLFFFAGCEATIEGCHVIIHNITEAERSKIRSLDDLRKLKNRLQKSGREILIIAAHPYYTLPFKRISLKDLLVKNIDIFDAIEHSSMYTYLINFNRKAIRMADKYHKPLLGLGDIHTLEQLGSNYTMVESEKSVNSIIRAIKKKHLKLVTKPLSIIKFFIISVKMLSL